VAVVGQYPLVAFGCVVHARTIYILLHGQLVLFKYIGASRILIYLSMRWLGWLLSLHIIRLSPPEVPTRVRSGLPLTNKPGGGRIIIGIPPKLNLLIRPCILATMFICYIHTTLSLRSVLFSSGLSETPALRFTDMLHSPPHYWVYKTIGRFTPLRPRISQLLYRDFNGTPHNPGREGAVPSQPN
jgi:hypothetical protein